MDVSASLYCADGLSRFILSFHYRDAATITHAHFIRKFNVISTANQPYHIKMTDTIDYHTEFTALFELQLFDTGKLDYRILDNNIPLLDKLAEMGNSGISVFDMHKKKHVYVSESYAHIFGYDMEELRKDDLAYFNAKIHPDDIIDLRINGLEMMRFIISKNVEEKLDYKLINEYRMLDARRKYIRVIEQQQVMELDPDGNIWLGLSILDLSPNQELEGSIKSQLFNFRTGTLIPINTNEVKPINPGLTKKETEVLSLVKEGLLSKEISHRLSISVHTVNTHRQRILEKLDADNSMEAVKKASVLGLLS